MNQRAIDDITEFMFMDDKPQISDVILIPGTSRYEITEKAAQLYHSGYARYIVPSGKYSSNFGRFLNENIRNPRYNGVYETESDYIKSVLIKNQVPESAILCENQATNTMENAQFSAQVLKDAGIKVNRAILCCQAFHSRRAFMSYARHFGDAEIFVCTVPTQGIFKESWYNDEKSYQKVMSELKKCGEYFNNMK